MYRTNFLKHYWYNAALKTAVYAMVEIFVGCIVLWSVHLLTNFSTTLAAQLVLSLIAAFLVVAGMHLRMHWTAACGFIFGGLLCFVSAIMLTPHQMSSLSAYTFISGMAVLSLLFMKIFPENGETIPFDRLHAPKGYEFLEKFDEFQTFGMLVLICAVGINVGMMMPLSSIRQSVIAISLIGIGINTLIAVGYTIKAGILFPRG